jgi:hypothetical protein
MSTPAHGRIMRCKFTAKPGQIESSIDLPHQMIFGNRVAEMKLVEQLTLVTLQTAHHGPRRDSRQHDGITLAGLSQPTFATKSARMRLVARRRRRLMTAINRKLPADCRDGVIDPKQTSAPAWQVGKVTKKDSAGVIRSQPKRRRAAPSALPQMAPTRVPRRAGAVWSIARWSDLSPRSLTFEK